MQERRQRLGLTSINSVLEPTCCLKHRRKFSSVGRICASCGDQRVRVTLQPCQGRSESARQPVQGSMGVIFCSIFAAFLEIRGWQPFKGEGGFSKKRF